MVPGIGARTTFAPAARERAAAVRRRRSRKNTQRRSPCETTTPSPDTSAAHSRPIGAGCAGAPFTAKQSSPRGPRRASTDVPPTMQQVGAGEFARRSPGGRAPTRPRRRAPARRRAASRSPSSIRSSQPMSTAPSRKSSDSRMEASWFRLVVTPSIAHASIASVARVSASARVGGVDDGLGQHRIVEGSDDVAAARARVVPRPRVLRSKPAQSTGRRHVAARRVLGVDTGLDRVAVERNLVLAGSRAARRRRREAASRSNRVR